MDGMLILLGINQANTPLVKVGQFGVTGCAVSDAILGEHCVKFMPLSEDVMAQVMEQLRVVDSLLRPEDSRTVDTEDVEDVESPKENKRKRPRKPSNGATHVRAGLPKLIMFARTNIAKSDEWFKTMRLIEKDHLKRDFVKSLDTHIKDLD